MKATVTLDKTGLKKRIELSVKEGFDDADLDLQTKAARAHGMQIARGYSQGLVRGTQFLLSSLEIANPAVGGSPVTVRTPVPHTGIGAQAAVVTVETGWDALTESYRRRSPVSYSFWRKTGELSRAAQSELTPIIAQLQALNQYARGNKIIMRPDPKKLERRGHFNLLLPNHWPSWLAEIMVPSFVTGSPKAPTTHPGENRFGLWRARWAEGRRPLLARYAAALGQAFSMALAALSRE